MDKQLEFLDILNIISFIVQLQNSGNIIQMQDVQKEVDRAIDLLNEHLLIQDEKINKILEALSDENHQKAI